VERKLIHENLNCTAVNFVELSLFLFSECLFGHAPFASKTFKQLEDKIRDTKPVQVSFE
jgi:hypothetical protein